MTAHVALVERVFRQQVAWPERVARSDVGTLSTRPEPARVASQTVSAVSRVPRYDTCTAHNPPPAAILVIEADPGIGGGLVEQLAADGYRAELARTAEHSRILAARRLPKLAVIGDLDSPRGALDLLGEIRAADRERVPWRRELPVIVISSRAHELDVLRAFDTGADDFLARPARYLELRARLRAVLRRSESVAEHERLLQIGALAIDVDAHRVSLYGQPIDLRPLEYQLLLQLAGAPDRVFGKQELLRSVWGYQSKAVTRTLDSHASRLRRKLDVNGSGGWVINIWGVGYRLT
jgi:DNA-binding response OmpR family regulator